MGEGSFRIIQKKVTEEGAPLWWGRGLRTIEIKVGPMSRQWYLSWDQVISRALLAFAVKTDPEMT